MKAVSLFSNCGAGDLGYKNAGFNFVVMAEIIPHRLNVALLNHPKATGVIGDIRNNWEDIVEKYTNKANAPLSLLAACPPCQGMSSSRNDRGLEDDPDAGSKDERNLLVVPIAKIAKELVPSLIVVENVPAFLTKKIWHPINHTPISAAKFLIEELESNYDVYPLLTDLADYGIPQSRKRAFLTFVNKSQYGLETLKREGRIPYPQVTHGKDGQQDHVTIGEALESFGLPSLDAGSEELAICTTHGILHSVPVWNKRMYQMVQAIPTHNGGSAWDNNKCPNCGIINVGIDDAECPQCNEGLLRPIVKENGTYRLVKGYRSTSYRRMKTNLPSTTITTANGHIGSSTTIHPYQNRLMSPLECALLQTFPIDFNWGDTIEKFGHTNVRHMIGEAVPPQFTRLHGLVLADLLESQTNSRTLTTKDERYLKACDKLSITPFY